MTKEGVNVCPSRQLFLVVYMNTFSDTSGNFEENYLLPDFNPCVKVGILGHLKCSSIPQLFE